ncbi:MAG: hypothetical protein HOW59_41350, partial [Nonomuraea sp.]|nr:hypothetical protein [Nonomuraea sp.]
MPRTSALRALRRLTRDHHDAHRLGLPVDDLRGLRAEAATDGGLARRELLKRAALAGLG